MTIKTMAALMTAFLLAGALASQQPRQAPPVLPRQAPATDPDQAPPVAPDILTLHIRKGAVKYTPARFTQQLFNRVITQRVPRSNIELKWQVPGGLESVPKGWQSELYKHVPEGGQVWRGRIDVLNSFGNLQAESGYKRSYADGAWFADVLKNDSGVVFEIRTREKRGGKWESETVYKDKNARPAGYTGLTQTCASCHNEAGTGGYAAGLVPGGDTVLSDPFDALENNNIEVVSPNTQEEGYAQVPSFGPRIGGNLRLFGRRR